MSSNNLQTSIDKIMAEDCNMLTTNSGVCNHIKDVPMNIKLKNLWIIRNLVVHNKADTRKKYESCSTCKNQPSVFVCLLCAYPSCKSHIVHSSNHFIFIDISFGQIFCSICQNIIFTRDYIIKNPIGTFIDKDSKTLIKEFADEIGDEKGHTGLRGFYNMHNTCFANSILQAFFHIPIIRNFFLSGTFRCCDAFNVNCFLCNISMLFQEVYNGSNDIICPSDLLLCIWRRYPQLTLNEQHDVHEFYLIFLQIASESFNNIQRLKNSKNFIDLMFYGEIKSNITCENCGNILSEVKEPFSDLSLQVFDNQSSNSYSNPLLNLKECLYQFTKTEFLGSDSLRDCNYCFRTVPCNKEMKVSQLPIILTLHLKRFEHHVLNNNITITKVSNYISFEKELDMKNFLTSENSNSCEDTTFTLKCVVVHKGTIENGHYICYISDDHKQWFLCDDGEIQQVEEIEVLKCEAYIMFYQKNKINYF